MRYISRNQIGPRASIWLEKENFRPSNLCPLLKKMWRRRRCHEFQRFMLKKTKTATKSQIPRIKFITLTIQNITSLNYIILKSVSINKTIPSAFNTFSAHPSRPNNSQLSAQRKGAFCILQKSNIYFSCFVSIKWLSSSRYRTGIYLSTELSNGILKSKSKAIRMR